MFDFGDVFEIPNGAASKFIIDKSGNPTVKPVCMEQWTISFWVILPMTVFQTDKKHILVQNIHGKGAYIQITENGNKLQV